MNLLGFVFRGVLAFGARAAGTEMVRRLAVNKGVTLVRSFIHSWIIPGLNWVIGNLLSAVDRFTPEEIDVKLKEKSASWVKRVDEEWTSEEKIRFVLDTASKLGVDGSVEKLKGLPWELVKANAPAEVLEMLDAVRRSQAADGARAQIKAETGVRPTISASIAAVEDSHEQLRGKELAIKAREVFAKLKSNDGGNQ